MHKASVLAIAVFLLAAAHPAASATCDKASLEKLEQDIGGLSGKAQKKAKRQLARAKKAFDAGEAKKCERIVGKINVGSSSGSGTSASARESIEEVVDDFADDFNDKDAAAVAQHYTEDAAALPPDQPRVEGRENIQKMWQAVIDSGATDFALTPKEVEDSGSLAFETGTFSLKVRGQDTNPVTVTGKYVVVWKKGTEGNWQLYRDIWNADSPMQAAGTK